MELPSFLFDKFYDPIFGGLYLYQYAILLAIPVFTIEIYLNGKYDASVSRAPCCPGGGGTR